MNNGQVKPDELYFTIKNTILVMPQTFEDMWEQTIYPNPKYLY
jgi:hypothetical protein